MPCQLTLVILVKLALIPSTKKYHDCIHDTQAWYTFLLSEKEECCLANGKYSVSVFYCLFEKYFGN